MEAEEENGKSKLSDTERWPAAKDVLPKSVIKVIKTKGAVFLEAGEEVKVARSWLGTLEIIDRDGDKHEWNIMNSKESPNFEVITMPDPMELLEAKMEKLEQKIMKQEEEDKNYVYSRIT